MRQKIAVVAAIVHGILFSLYGDCRDKIQALVSTLQPREYEGIFVVESYCHPFNTIVEGAHFKRW